jgi:hypothetical protein
VAGGGSWSLVASHEALEMLADPFGNRLVAGASPMESQGRVEFLVEVCDPCQDDDFAYTVNGILVSDFYTPNYFDPVRAEGVRYSFNGAISDPRQVLPGGYLSWREPVSDTWFQKNHFSNEPRFKSLGKLSPGNESFRAVIDRFTPETQRLSRVDPTKESMQRASLARKSAEAASAAKAKELLAQIAEMRARSKQRAMSRSYASSPKSSRKKR